MLVVSPKLACGVPRKAHNSWSGTKSQSSCSLSNKRALGTSPSTQLPLSNTLLDWGWWGVMWVWSTSHRLASLAIKCDWNCITWSEWICSSKPKQQKIYSLRAVATVEAIVSARVITSCQFVQWSNKIRIHWFPLGVLRIDITRSIATFCQSWPA